jgi:hypothetical protein
MSVPKKSLNDGSTHPFSSPSSDQTHDDKVSCMQDSPIQFPTLLSITEAQKERVRRSVPDFIFLDRLQVSQFLSTKWPLSVPEFIVVQQFVEF